MNICKQPECDQKVRARGWCGGHYEQWRRGTPLRPLNTTAQLEEKYCPSCEAVKGAEDFYQRKHSVYLSTYCRVCTKRKAKESKKRRKSNEGV